MAIPGQNSVNPQELLRQRQAHLAEGAAAPGMAARLEGDHRHRLHFWWWKMADRLSRRRRPADPS